MLTDEQIDSVWDGLDGPKIISGSDCAEWNKQIRRAFARSILAAHSAGAQAKPAAYVGWGGEGKPKTLLLREEGLPVGSPLYAQPSPQPTTDDMLKVLTDLRRKLAALPHRQIELALGEYQAWMLKGDAFDLIDAEIERIERAGVKT